MQYKYGGAPTDLGYIDTEASEMCYVQYLPIHFPKSEFRVPENLKWCLPLVQATLDDYDWNKYVYLTAKHYFVNNLSCNRPGWHSDGFGTNDINFIWYDAHPTEFCEQDFWLCADHIKSMREMEEQYDLLNVREYPCKHLLRMDQKVIHRVSGRPFEGMRTFVKISISDNKYNLKGNAHNFLFDYNWDMFERGIERNDPVVSVID